MVEPTQEKAHGVVDNLFQSSLLVVLFIITILIVSGYAQ